MVTPGERSLAGQPTQLMVDQAVNGHPKIGGENCPTAQVKLVQLLDPPCPQGYQQVACEDWVVGQY